MQFLAKKRGYVEEVEGRTLRIRLNRFDIPMMPFGKRFCVFLHAQIRSVSLMLAECLVHCI